MYVMYSKRHADIIPFANECHLSCTIIHSLIKVTKPTAPVKHYVLEEKRRG